MSIINLIIVAKYVVGQVLIFPDVFNRKFTISIPIAKLLKMKKKEKEKEKVKTFYLYNCYMYMIVKYMTQCYWGNVDVVS